MEIPEPLKKSIRSMMLEDMESDTLDHFELGLFEWYVRETEAVLSTMLTTEQTYIQEQVASGVPDINDSGMLALEYYTKRSRYSHIIYLTSLLEECLARACEKVRQAIGNQSIPFELSELSGDQWTKKRKFIERYGRFTLPTLIWCELESLILVRNVLVHENGRTASLKANQRKQLEKQQGIDLDGYEFKLEESYVRHAYMAVREFVKALESGVSEVINRAKRPIGIA
jgi:hypothetical protein